MGNWTPGPWRVLLDGIDKTGNEIGQNVIIHARGGAIAKVFRCGNPQKAFGDASLSDMPESDEAPIRMANAHVMAAAPTQHAEMLRYLPIIERAEADPELWARLTEGTGVATANGYRAALAAATGAK